MKKDFIKQTAADYLAENGEVAAARYLAHTLFADETDKAGMPYTGHLRRVAEKVTGTVQRTIGWLHDLLEDIDGWTAADLEDIGFSEDVVAGVEAMTHAGDTLYLDMIVELGTVAQAVPVKMSDLEDNSNLLRLPHLLTEKDIERAKKYKLAHAYLTDIYTSDIEPGTPLIDWILTKPDNMRDWTLIRKYSNEGPSISPYIYPGL